MNLEPFNHPEADVVLRTSDGVSLKTHSRILAESSPFFSDLLTLPQPPSDVSSSPAIVDIPERAEVMHLLLMLISPIANRPVETLGLLGDALGAALKYDMGLAIQSLRQLLVSPRFIQNEPSRVYAIACRHQLEEEAKAASTHTLTINLLDAPLSDELKFITAYDYHRLLDLHRTRGAAAQKLLVHDRGVRCPLCSGNQMSVTPPRWWIDFEARAKLELQQRPVSDVIFSLPFLARSSQAGCQRCGGSIFESHEFLANLKRAIDNLPATI